MVIYMTINFFDPDKAAALGAMGFLYHEQRAGDGKNIYVFVETPELIKVLSEKFSKHDFYYDRNLCL